ncbi:hypothetical protein DICSQDRAFT_138158 [Dichomitus squalens LYAD-421 SS1]|uniref:Secreted protein n=1 Tax=Dichomitus squalens (strain LYAD-421) TaxID=732165 RepID=R7SV51_DICSQ|nr:uncharacterized protein DICSQDRAFT_138158 [Dichomitus squalens LYAD-421 SS1]EJF59946.1 hypothetical protein DICSQDRAFT_138158 [Dichomitus squalens LYAD-421 SS1]
MLSAGFLLATCFLGVSGFLCWRRPVARSSVGGCMWATKIFAIAKLMTRVVGQSFGRHTSLYRHDGLEGVERVPLRKFVVGILFIRAVTADIAQIEVISFVAQFMR